MTPLILILHPYPGGTRTLRVSGKISFPVVVSLDLLFVLYRTPPRPIGLDSPSHQHPEDPLPVEDREFRNTSKVSTDPARPDWVEGGRRDHSDVSTSATPQPSVTYKS